MNLNASQADGREAQLIQVQAKNNQLEMELAHLHSSNTKAEQQVASKRDWAEKRLKDEEATIYELQNQVRIANATLVAEREAHEKTKFSYDKELKKQYALVRTCILCGK